MIRNAGIRFCSLADDISSFYPLIFCSDYSQVIMLSIVGKMVALFEDMAWVVWSSGRPYCVLVNLVVFIISF